MIWDTLLPCRSGRPSSSDSLSRPGPQISQFRVCAQNGTRELAAGCTAIPAPPRSSKETSLWNYFLLSPLILSLLTSTFFFSLRVIFAIMQILAFIPQTHFSDSWNILVGSVLAFMCIKFQLWIFSMLGLFFWGGVTDKFWNNFRISKKLHESYKEFLHSLYPDSPVVNISSLASSFRLCVDTDFLGFLSEPFERKL